MWPRTAKPAKSRWTPIQDTANFRPMGCYTALLVFTDYSSRMFISQFPANKITEIDFEHHFAVVSAFFLVFLNVFFSKS